MQQFTRLITKYDREEEKLKHIQKTIENELEYMQGFQTARMLQIRQRLLYIQNDITTMIAQMYREKERAEVLWNDHKKRCAGRND